MVVNCDARMDARLEKVRAWCMTRAIMDSDRAVEAGIFTYDLATWYGAPGHRLPISS